MRRKSPLGAAFSAGPVLALGLSLALCVGQDSPPAPQGLTPLNDAVRATVQDGRPTVVLVTSTAQPASVHFRDTFLASAARHGLFDRLRFAEVSAEADPERVQSLKIARFPAVLVYRKGPNGNLALAGHRFGPMDAYSALTWLGTLDLSGAPMASRPSSDPAVARASFGDGGTQPSGQSYPSPQYPPPPPKSPPTYAPPSYAPPVAYAPPAQYAAPVPALAPVILQSAPPTMIVQQQPQQIVLAPAPPPQITVAMAPPSGPSVTYAMAPPPAGSAPPNLFMAAPVASAPPAGSAPPGYAPVASAPPMMMAPVAMAPPSYGSAPPQQQVGQGPIAATVLTAVLTNPSLINRLLGAFGEHLAQKKNPRVQLGQSPFGQAPVGQAPVGQAPVGQAPMGYAYAPAGQQAYAYVPAPAQGYAPYGFVPNPGYAPPPEENYNQPPAQPAPPMPTPQSAPTRPTKHWFPFHR